MPNAKANADTPWRKVFCLEGSWENDLADQTSVRPVLELLQRLGRIEFIHRDVGTRPELEHYLRRWGDEASDYRVLYLAFHGDDSGIWISDDTDGEASLDFLGSLLADRLDGCVVHFGSCSVMSAKDRRLDRFIDQTAAKAVIGYAGAVDWAQSAAMDLLTLDTLAWYKQLGTALNRLSSDPAHKSLRRELGFKIHPS